MCAFGLVEALSWCGCQCGSLGLSLYSSPVFSLLHTHTHTYTHILYRSHTHTGSPCQAQWFAMQARCREAHPTLPSRSLLFTTNLLFAAVLACSATPPLPQSKKGSTVEALLRPSTSSPRRFSPVNTSRGTPGTTTGILAGPSSTGTGGATVFTFPPSPQDTNLSFTAASAVPSGNAVGNAGGNAGTMYETTTTATSDTWRVGGNDENAAAPRRRPGSAKTVQLPPVSPWSAAGTGHGGGTTTTASVLTASKVDEVLASSVAAQQALATHRRLHGSVVLDGTLSGLFGDSQGAAFASVVPLRHGSGAGGGGGGGSAAGAGRRVASSVPGGGGGVTDSGPVVPSGRAMMKEVLHIPKSIDGLRKAFDMPFERLKFVQRDW